MKHFLGIGVAGNFADHLEQAGEASDFCNIVSDEEGAPKGIFPFYVNTHQRLSRYCFNNQQIILPLDSSFNVQAEPEVGLECEIIYENDRITNLIPKFFMAFDDTSIRNDRNATKISQKKNFSSGCKAYGNKIEIDKFESGGICDNFSIISFIEFDGKLHLYGECSPLTGYSFFYQRLICWLVHKLNHQKDEFVLEDFREIIIQNNKPKKCIVAIGATRYTELGETRFLKENDLIYIAVFNHKKYTQKQIEELLSLKEIPLDYNNLSIIKQKVVKDK